jgi:hypothetical protein
MDSLKHMLNCVFNENFIKSYFTLGYYELGFLFFLEFSSEIYNLKGINRLKIYELTLSIFLILFLLNKNSI